MTDSSPADLAVAFRSFGRRLNQALSAAEDDADRQAAARALVPQLEQVIAESARAFGLEAGDVAMTGAAVAAHIDSIHAEQWDDATLNRLRDLAIRAGKALRDIEAAATK
jgi:2-keto-4-pentenoate hydratase/2-oxohepta-3-ene-1,7-dioic acid hydratase in catechol pathway